MPASLGKLLVELSADVADFQSDMGRAARTMDRQAKNIERSGKRIDTMFLRMGKTVKAFAAIVGAGFSASHARGQIEVADATAKLATRLTESTEALSEYAFVAERAGVESSNFGRAIQVQERLISDAAAGIGQAQDALEELGLDPNQLENLTPIGRFRALGTALQGIERESRRVALAQKIWQSEGVQLLQIVNQGNAAIEDQIALGRSLGVTLSEDMADQAQKAADDMQSMSTSINTISRDLALLLAAPAAQFFKDVADTIAIARYQFENLFNTTAAARLKDTVDEMAAVVDKLEILKKQRDELGELSPLAKGVLEQEIAELEKTYDRLKKAYAELTLGEDSGEGAGALAGEGGGGRGDGRSDENEEAEKSAKKVADAYTKVWTNIDLATTKTEEFVDETTNLERAGQGLGFAMANTFDDVAFSIGNASSALDVLEQGLIDVARVFTRAFVSGPLAESIADLFLEKPPAVPASQYVTGTNILRNRDSGGFGMAGQSYLIGRGAQPELFIPKTSGTFIPNADELGGDRAVINFKVNAIDSQSFQGALAQNERLITGIVRKGFARRGARIDIS